MLNFITGLLLYKQEGSVYNVLLVIIDCYTKIAKYIPTTKLINVIGLANLIFKKIVYVYSALASMTLDRGSVFTSLY